MKNDVTIKKDVLEELQWEPSIDGKNIGVSVKDGIVTLFGQVGTYAEKIAAEEAVKRISGVRAVVEEIEVKVGSGYQRSDQEIARAALDHLEWTTSLPLEKIKLKVEDGWVTLEGEVEWNYQKTAAKNAINRLSGVRGVDNLIEVKASIEPQNIKQKIRSAFERNATIDAESVSVLVHDHKVTLNGTVQSLVEKKQAERAAWSAPGVNEVENNLEIKVRAYA